MPSLARPVVFGSSGERKLEYASTPARRGGHSLSTSLITPPAAGHPSCKGSETREVSKLSATRPPAHGDDNYCELFLPSNVAMAHEAGDIPQLRLALEKALCMGGNAMHAPSAPSTVTYQPSGQAMWARQRLLGAAAEKPENGEIIRSDDLDIADRRRRLQAIGWLQLPVAVTPPSQIDRLEAALREHLGLHAGAGGPPRAARLILSECDPSRSGKVDQKLFISTFNRRLNVDAPGVPQGPGGGLVQALFCRYDMERTGIIAADNLVDALQGGSTGARCVRLIGRLREGLHAHSGGLEDLRLVKLEWDAQASKEATDRGSMACIPREKFSQGVSELAKRSCLEVTAAEMNALVTTFEPPSEPLAAPIASNGNASKIRSESAVAYGEFALAVRGPSMSGQRRRLVQQAYQALQMSGRALVPHHLALRYDVSKHPGVIDGSLSKSEAAMAFLAPWKDHAESVVNVDAFCERYEWVSAEIESDAHFELMVRDAWGLPSRSIA